MEGPPVPMLPAGSSLTGTLLGRPFQYTFEAPIQTAEDLKGAVVGAIRAAGFVVLEVGDGSYTVQDQDGSTAGETHLCLDRAPAGRRSFDDLIRDLEETASWPLRASQIRSDGYMDLFPTRRLARRGYPIPRNQVTRGTRRR